MNQEKNFGQAVGRLIRSEDLSREEAREYFRQILSDETTDMHQGAFLAALSAKGESAGEIAGSWEAIYELDTIKVEPRTDSPLVDNCGTGMDSFKTFNISTAASIIAAAGGVTMARHGARAITSVCGTLDILERLGVDVECDPQLVKKSIEEAGIGIFNGMSPRVHPRALGRILSQISFGTVLNTAASLASPVLPRYGVRGVHSRDMVRPVAEVMREIGYRKALVVHGLAGDGVRGMDEASTLGETFVAELQEDGGITSWSFFPEELGIRRGIQEELAPLENPEEEALRMIRLISGQDTGSRLDIACLNAGLILTLMNRTNDLRAGYLEAREIVASGKALQKLEHWVSVQNENQAAGRDRLESLIRRAGAGLPA